MDKHSCNGAHRDSGESTLRVEIHGIAASIRGHSLKSTEAAALRARLAVMNELHATGEAAAWNAEVRRSAPCLAGTMRVEICPVVANVDVTYLGAFARGEGEPALCRAATVPVGCGRGFIFLHVSDGHTDLHVGAISESKLRGGCARKYGRSQGKKQNHVSSSHFSHAHAGMRDSQRNTAMKSVMSIRWGEGVMIVVLYDDERLPYSCVSGLHGGTASGDCAGGGGEPHGDYSAGGEQVR